MLVLNNMQGGPFSHILFAVLNIFDKMINSYKIKFVGRPADGESHYHLLSLYRHCTCAILEMTKLAINMVIKVGSCLLWVSYLWSSVELVLSNFRIGIIDDCKINCRLFVDNFFIFLLNEKFGQILDMHVHVLFIK